MAKFLILPGSDGFEQMRPETVQLLQKLFDSTRSSTHQQSGLKNSTQTETSEKTSLDQESIS